MHYTIKILGKVQGVFFRYFTKKTADKLGIQGTVKNLPDGSVWIEATGEDEDMEEFIQWCHRGSPASKVQEVRVTPHDTAKSFQKFVIMR